jgi:hypothetical protein
VPQALAPAVRQTTSLGLAQTVMPAPSEHAAPTADVVSSSLQPPHALRATGSSQRKAGPLQTHVPAHPQGAPGTSGSAAHVPQADGVRIAP